VSEDWKRVKRSVPLHPVLFAVLPALFLYARNRSEVRPAELVWPLLIAVPASLLVWWLCSQALRDGTRGAVLASLFWLWFFSFDHVRRSLESLGAWAFSLQILNFLAWPLLAALLVRWRRGAHPLSSGLNAMAIALVAWQLVLVGGFEFHRARLPGGRAVAGEARLVAGRTDGTRPHIYFIVLDAYAREDKLREVYHYDNRDFLAYLTSRGFQVIPRARANYCQTLFSLVSCLDLDYLWQLRSATSAQQDAGGAQQRTGGIHRTQPVGVSSLPDQLSQNQVCGFLRRQGYRITAFRSGHDESELASADSHLSYHWHLDEFQLALVGSTPLGWAARQINSAWADPDRVHVETLRYTFAHLADPARSRSPVFVYAHILSPHPPFILHANGARRESARDRSRAFADYAAVKRDAYITGYREKLQFTNRMLRQALDQVLAEAKRPTAIVLVSDHGSRVPDRGGGPSAGSGSSASPSPVQDPDGALQGPEGQGAPRAESRGGPETAGVQESLSNLIALRLPGEQDPRPPDDLSMVNVFRLVLDRYFGTDLPLLPDKSYVCGEEFPSDEKAAEMFLRVHGQPAQKRRWQGFDD
jgi:hypothetical protein